MADRITEYALSGILADIARLIGLDAAVAVARALGGRRIFFGKEFTAVHPLAGVLGARAAKVVFRLYAGRGKVDVASARVYLRWHEARRLRRGGLTHREISRRLDITERRVEQLLEGFPLEEVGAEPLDPVAAPPSGCPLCHRGRCTPKRHDARQLTLL